MTALRSDALAFIDSDGARLKAGNLSAYISDLRRVGVNADPCLII